LKSLSRNPWHRRVPLGRTLRLRSGQARSGARPYAVFFGICILLSCASAQARVHHSPSWADTQFTKAEAQRETLNGRDEQDRTRREYETVIASYRRIVLEAPTSSKADGSAFAVAELAAEMGRHFRDDMSLYAAVREYKFLRKEYPGSKHRIEALLAIGEIYKNDLGDDSDARAAFEELLQRYPNSHYAKDAKAELSVSTEQASAAKSESNSSENDAEQDVAQADDGSGAKEPTGDRAAEHGSPEKASNSKPVRVKDVQYWSMPDYTRVSVVLEQDVQFESQRIDHPERIFFDLKNARLSSHLLGQSFDVDDGLVKKVRVAQYKPGRARIVIETANHAAYNASLLSNPPRLIIDIHNDDAHDTDVHAVRVEKSGSDREVAAVSRSRDTADSDPATIADDNSAPSGVRLPGVPHSPKRVVVPADDESDAPAEATEAADVGAKPSGKSAKPSSHARSARTLASSRDREAQPTSNGDRSLIRALGLKIGKIVIDPGHGGHDTGTIGPNGLYEKDLVLDVSKRLGKLLEARLGAEVVFTRRDDTFIPLETRTAIANQEQADLFVSVHANSSHDPDARGVETYYLNFTSSPEALEVAARENAASDKSIHELQDLVKTIALKEKIEESREFAADVQQSLHTGLAAKSPGVRDRGVKKAPFVVLIGANMPSILAEISFISNPGDEKRLRSPEYRQRIAESLYRGISRYVNGLAGVKVATRMEKASGD
jgi:N-acetylmuramoyl-L-alanine amidase